MFAEMPGWVLYPEIEEYTPGIVDNENNGLLENGETGQGIPFSHFEMGETSRARCVESTGKEVTAIAGQYSYGPNVTEADAGQNIYLAKGKSENLELTSRQMCVEATTKEINAIAAENSNGPNLPEAEVVQNISLAKDESEELELIPDKSVHSESSSDNELGDGIQSNIPEPAIIELSDDEGALCEMVVKNSYVKYRGLEVPFGVAEFLPKSNIEVVLKTPEKCYPMSYSGHRQRPKFGNGWGVFVAENNLCAKDRVLFEWQSSRNGRVTLNTRIVKFNVTM